MVTANPFLTSPFAPRRQPAHVEARLGEEWLLRLHRDGSLPWGRVRVGLAVTKNGYCLALVGMDSMSRSGAGVIQLHSPQQQAFSPIRLGDLAPHEFSAMTEPHRRELQVHCYRMLGTMQDA